MHSIPPPSAPTPGTEAPEPTVSLRLRLWAACFLGSIVAGAGGLWVLGTQWTPGESDLSRAVPLLAVVGGASVVAGFAAALWLDHHVVAHLRGVLLGLHTGRVAGFRGLPAARGWGELSQISDGVQALLAHQRQTARAAEELALTRQQLEALQSSLDEWVTNERWQAPALEPGLPESVSSAITRGLGRAEQLAEQHREVARQIAADLVSTLPDAQESAEQAERGFVEATALLTSVRELQRLSLELQNALVQVTPAAPAAEPAPLDARFREAARDALEELVAASSESVAAISNGLMHVQDIAAQVQRLGNRSTLIAIHAVMGGARGGADALTDELRQLAADVRSATDRTSELAREIEQEVERASARMRGVRERAMARLDAAPPAEPAERRPAAERRAWDDAQRLLERVREMVQDAARKGERLSAAGERASRAAERLSRRLEEETRETEALALRLAPVGDAVAPAAVPLPGLRMVAPGEGDAEPEAGADPPAIEHRPEESR
jgi:hypothetical protein